MTERERELLLEIGKAAVNAAAILAIALLEVYVTAPWKFDRWIDRLKPRTPRRPLEPSHAAVREVLDHAERIAREASEEET